MFWNSKRVATIIAREALRAMTVSTSDRRTMTEPSSLAADTSGDKLTCFFKQMHPRGYSRAKLVQIMRNLLGCL
jgi:hypothetical protein